MGGAWHTHPQKGPWTRHTHPLEETWDQAYHLQKGPSMRHTYPQKRCGTRRTHPQKGSGTRHTHLHVDRMTDRHLWKHYLLALRWWAVISTQCLEGKKNNLGMKCTFQTRCASQNTWVSLLPPQQPSTNIHLAFPVYPLVCVSIWLRK